MIVNKPVYLIIRQKEKRVNIYWRFEKKEIFGGFKYGKNNSVKWLSWGEANKREKGGCAWKPEGFLTFRSGYFIKMAKIYI